MQGQNTTFYGSCDQQTDACRKESTTYQKQYRCWNETQLSPEELHRTQSCVYKNKLYAVVYAKDYDVIATSVACCNSLAKKEISETIKKGVGDYELSNFKCKKCHSYLYINLCSVCLPQLSFTPIRPTMESEIMFLRPYNK